MKPYLFNVDIHIFDTDCFGVMWHGAYTKWLEMGRVNLFKSVGIEISLPGDPAGYIYPVVEQNLKFKAPARLGDVLTITTQLTVEGYKLQFQQTCRNLHTDKVTLEAATTVVVLNSDWKMMRKLPADLLDKLENFCV